MFYCPGCKIFIPEDSVDEFEQFSEAWGRPVSETWLVCPCCGEPVEEREEDEQV